MTLRSTTQVPPTAEPFPPDKKAGRPTGCLGQAVRYLLNQVHHGQVAIDNNGIERDVRPLAVGRKNWLFTGSPAAGERTAVILNPPISARHHGADPEAYLRDLIERLPGCGSDEASLRQLLPENWASAHKSSQEPSASQKQAAACPPPPEIQNSPAPEIPKGPLGRLRMDDCSQFHGRKLLLEARKGKAPFFTRTSRPGTRYRERSSDSG